MSDLTWDLSGSYAHVQIKIKKQKFSFFYLFIFYAATLDTLIICTVVFFQAAHTQHTTKEQQIILDVILHRFEMKKLLGAMSCYFCAEVAQQHF